MKRLLRARGAAGAAGGLRHHAARVGDPAPQLEDRAAEAAYQEVLDAVLGPRRRSTTASTRGCSRRPRYQTLAFREARVRRGRRSSRRCPRAKLEELLAEERAEAAQFHEFFLGVHVNDYRYDDFDQQERPSGAWRW